MVEEAVSWMINMRIQKILSDRGIASRRQAEQMIIDGRVTCNGIVCTLGQTADPENDIIAVDGIQIPDPSGYVYIMLHKPKGYVTTLSDEKGRKNAAMLVANCGRRVYPVGRLDMDSEGLLLFTNDGAFANQIMHPRHQIKKVYCVDVKGYSTAAFEQLKRPVMLDGHKVSSPELEILSVQGDRASLLITITEGRNRQVRRMCARVGMQVKRLVRIQEGTLKLNGLKTGEWRYLTDSEIRGLYHE